MFENQQRDDVEKFIGNNPDTRRLYFHHQELNDKLEEAGRGCLPLSDQELTRMKMDKLHAKEKLQRMWESWRASGPH
ncbi:DUF465 domain-containing protein [Bacillus sp. NP157]|nr:DUF465 domain-containing protein [Bacillus sp. NP157]